MPNSYTPIVLSSPTPVASRGRAIAPPKPTTAIVYDGGPIPSFLLNNGLDPTKFRQFLIKAKIGNPFDLPDGLEIEITPTDLKIAAFSVNPEA